MIKSIVLKLYMLLGIILILNSCKKKEEESPNLITGKEWIKLTDSASFSKRASHCLVVYKEKIWLIGGNHNDTLENDVWNSSDAIHWKLVNENVGFDISNGSIAVVFEDKIWLNVRKDIYNSSDGICWQKATTIPEIAAYGKNMTVFKNKLWITGGWENSYKNEIWSSTDGINWEKINPITCFTIRANHSFVVFSDKMWVIAGQSGINKNDVWYSEDGINWLSGKTKFPVRHVSQVVEFKDRLWLIAGFGVAPNGDFVMLSDVWNSDDGLNWTLVNDLSPFGKRMEHAAIVFKNKIFVIGGETGIPPTSLKSYNDVWYTE